MTNRCHLHPSRFGASTLATWCYTGWVGPGPGHMLLLKQQKHALTCYVAVTRFTSVVRAPVLLRPPCSYAVASHLLLRL